MFHSYLIPSPERNDVPNDGGHHTDASVGEAKVFVSLPTFFWTADDRLLLGSIRRRHSDGWTIPALLSSRRL